MRTGRSGYLLNRALANFYRTQPFDSDGRIFMVGLEVLTEKQFLARFRPLWARIVAAGRYDRRFAEAARIRRDYVHVSHNPGDAWRFHAFPRLGRLNKWLARSTRPQIPFP